MSSLTSKSDLSRKIKDLGIRGIPTIPPLPDITRFKKCDTVGEEMKILLNRKRNHNKDMAFQQQRGHSENIQQENERRARQGRRKSRILSISPIEQFLIDGILHKIPMKGRHLDLTETVYLNSLIRDVQENYEQTMKTAIENWLCKKAFCSDTNTMEMAKFPTLNFKKNRRDVKKTLFLLDPAMSRLLQLCKNVLGSMKVLNESGYREFGVMTAEKFQDRVASDCFQFEQTILHNWYPQAVSIVMSVESKNKKNEDILAFQKCATSVLSAQLKDVVHRVLHEFAEFYQEKDGYCFPKLKLTLNLDNDTIIVAPSLKELIDTLETVVQQIICSIRCVPTVESHLSKCGAAVIDTSLPGNVVEAAFEIVAKSVQRHYLLPQQYAQELEVHYECLVKQTTKKKLSEFFKKPYNFNDYCQEIEKFQMAYKELVCMASSKHYPMFQVDTSELTKALAETANVYREMLLTRVVDNQRRENLRICLDFEKMKKKLQKVPSNTKEMVNLSTYLAYAQSDVIPNIEGRVKHSYTQLMYTINFCNLEEDIVLNSHALLVLGQIPHLIENCTEVIGKCGIEFEELYMTNVEKLSLEIEKLHCRVKELQVCGDIEAVAEYIQDVKSIQKRICNLRERVQEINEEEVMFKFPLSTYPELDDVTVELEIFDTLFKLIFSWKKSEKKWMDGNFLDLDAEIVEAEVDSVNRDLHRLLRVFKTQMKNQESEGKRSIQWGEKKDDSEVAMPAARMCCKVLENIREFKQHMPVINIMCQPGVGSRHWNQMSQLLGFTIVPSTGATLRKVLKCNLFPHLDKLEPITATAAKEYSMTKSVQKLIREWDYIKFSTTQYRETGISILTAVEDIQLTLDDHIIKVQTMRGSPFVKPFEEEIKAWEERLVRAQETIDEWLKVQVQWLYLEPIFSSKDIVQQMAKEGELFLIVCNHWKGIMKEVVCDPKVMSTAGSESMRDKLISCNEILERINKGLSDYLETKRLYFPRFFFLSNDEMLEILSETRDPRRVQPHLKKCFEGIAELYFDQDLTILAMCSREGEKVTLSEPVDTVVACGQVEKWLLQVQDVMVKSVHEVMNDAQQKYKCCQRKEWLKSWPGQIALCVSQMFWTKEVDDALRDPNPLKSLQRYASQQKMELEDIVELVRGNLSEQARITLGALVVMDVHSRDVVESLIEKGISSPNEFEWLAQLRYYWENDDCMVRITNASVKYMYEYLGNSPRLVITPLTDRCYRTLIGAYHLHLNGAPEGPAGTGKTETVKDLAKALAVQCIVFNCSEGLDYLAMGKLFKGLATCGAWACFDEFNRIDLEVLSVVAQQMLCIVQAIRSKMTTFIFDGTELQLNPTCYTCITMNPGYSGRTELPDNLKVLFRSVAMMVPDYKMIAEISLYSCGFLDAHELSAKVISTYRLCSEQLSPQSHYDYGMRAVKTVLAAAGSLKLKYPKEKEDILILRALVDLNLPKFLPRDIPLFEGIVADLFPGVDLPNPDHTIFVDAMQEICRRRNLQPCEIFLRKIEQTYETMLARHGFVLVGEPFGGKTMILQVLADTLNLMHTLGKGSDGKVNFLVINPKSLTMGQLYGQFDTISHEWTDGVASTAFREFATSTSCDRQWIIFDGPVDSIWVENLNAVLDDNKKLCLLSGEIISMSPLMSIIFEVNDLQHASPATVSRCGMIYVEPTAMGWAPLVKSWIWVNDCIWKNGNEVFITALFDWLFEPCMEFYHKHCESILKLSDIHLVNSFLNVVEAVMSQAIAKCKESDAKYFKVWTMASFMFGLVWSLGAICNSESRDKMSVFMTDFMAGKCAEYPVPAEFGKIECLFPSEGLVFDYVYEFQRKGHWRHWREFIWELESETENTSIWKLVVPTIDTIRYSYMMDIFIKCDKPLLLVGPTGTGKSAYVKNKLLNGLRPVENYAPLFMSFSAQSTTTQTLDTVLAKLEKRRKGVFGPAVGKKCIIFIDDLNLPAKDTFGAQPPLELVRHFFDHHYWFHHKDLTKIILQDIQFIAAAGLTKTIPCRVLRHFNVLATNPFSDEIMQHVFTTIMNQHLRLGAFTVEVFPVVNCVVSATLSIYKASMLQLLPTPSKSHYMFNLRDVARIILGCCLIKKESVQNKRTFTKLWVHEVLRVIYDRLIDECDRTWLFLQIKECIKVNFKDNVDLVFDNLGGKNRKVTEEDMQTLLFGDYLQQDAPSDERLYQEVTDVQQFQSVSEKCLEEYNNVQKSKLNIVVFRYALEHLSRICRIFRIPGGHILLLGVSGSGRQSLTRLAANLSGITLCQPEITKNYSKVEWKEDLKNIIRSVGVAGKRTAFMVTDSQIKDESFLDDINSLLNSGEIPNIFSLEEKQEIILSVRPIFQSSSKGTDLTPLSIFEFFLSRCRQNLHLVLAFSPINKLFRSRLREFPSLVNCCTVDWFQAWPKDALERVAQCYLQRCSLNDTEKQSIVKICQYFHITATDLASKFTAEKGLKLYITPSSFLVLIDTFQLLLKQKIEEVTKSKERYRSGVQKLIFATGQIADMQKELEILQPQLLEATANAHTMMTEIEEESKQAEEKRSIVRCDEAEANIQAENAKILRDECQADLAEAIPSLEAAISALDTLKPADITVLKSMKSPPQVVKLVVEAICVMKDIKPEKIQDPSGSGQKVFDYWGPSKKLLGEISFLSKLKEYDKDNIPAAIMTKIRKEYVCNPQFDPNYVAKASSAAEGLCKWVRAMEIYDRAAKIVAPKKVKLAESEESLSIIKAKLKAKQDELRVIEAHLQGLQEQLQDTLEKKDKMEARTDQCSCKLQRANELIKGLGGEKERWLSAAQDLEDQFGEIVGDILLSAAVLAYFGPFTALYRADCLKDWISCCKQHRIACSTNLSVSRVLGNPLQIQTWTILGLPSDNFSIDNAIIAYNSNKWPLMIDPEGQANKWVKNTEAEGKLSVVSLSDQDFMRTLERCVQTGNPVLIENIGEEVDPALEPLLLKQTYRQGGVEMIKLGNALLQYNLKFRLYLTTKLRNPHFAPELSTKVCIVNFAITPEGLEDQLLGIVVAKEKPELETAHHDLVAQSSANKKLLKEIEDRILVTLSSSEGNILEDKTAVEVLDSSKRLADDISAKQKVAEETEEMIENSRFLYRPVAKHSSVLFFCITELSNIQPMYRYSLVWFVNLFINSIENSERCEQLETRLKSITEDFNYSLYSNICRSLLERDKLLFSFLLCCNILISKNELEQSELSWFLTGGVGVGAELSNPDPSWLKQQQWEEVCRLDSLPAFQGICDHMRENIEQWKEVCNHGTFSLSTLPAPYNSKLHKFQMLCVLRCVSPEKVIIFVTEFVKNQLGSKYVQPPNFDLRKSYNDSNCYSPLLFILSPGTDPLSSIMKFAEECGYQGTNFHIVSLGQGQGPHAEEVIENARNIGGWVLLQNCHLATSWLPTLNRICTNLTQENTNSHFRLWLTSYPSSNFPVEILESSIKITNEPPTGLRLNLLQAYQNDPINDPTFFNGCPGKDIFRKLVFGLCFFHACVLERKKFGPIGWNIPYGFNESDLHISLHQLKTFVEEFDYVPFEAIRYTVGECNYGGRVTDDWDRRVLLTFLNDFCNEDMMQQVDQSSVILSCNSYQDFLEYIQKLPAVQEPEVFGLHKNVDIVQQLREARFLMDSALMARGQTLASQSDQTDGALQEMANDILHKLPQLFDLNEANIKYPTVYSESMNTVLLQEMESYNRLLEVITASLRSLIKAFVGLEMMTNDVESVASSLLVGKIPTMWLNHSYPSLKPLGSYISDLMDRVTSLRNWYDNGKPTVFWLPGLYFTQAFFTGVMQNYARKYTIPIDQLVFDFVVMGNDTPETSPTDGVYIGGLFLEGARWDRIKLVLAEQHSKVLWDAMPPIWLRPTLKKNLKKEERYECPLYKTSERYGTLSTTGHSTNFVLTVLLPTAAPVKHWIKRGVALVCQLDQ